MPIFHPIQLPPRLWFSDPDFYREGHEEHEGFPQMIQIKSRVNIVILLLFSHAGNGRCA